MIDLELWRARIGLFQGRLIARALRKSAASASAGKKARAKAAPDSQGLRSAVAVAAVVNLLMILLTATTIASKLLMAGDVEPNPGPETRGMLVLGRGRGLPPTQLFKLAVMQGENAEMMCLAFDGSTSVMSCSYFIKDSLVPRSSPSFCCLQYKQQKQLNPPFGERLGVHKHHNCKWPEGLYSCAPYAQKRVSGPSPSPMD